MNEKASAEMHLPPVKKELNINTIISLIGFLIMVGGMIYAYGQFTSQVYQTEQAFKEYRTTTDQRMSGIETTTRQIDNLTYRMATVETATSAFARALEDLRSEMSQQSGDIRVVREILQRIDRQSPAVFAPTASVDP